MTDELRLLNIDLVSNCETLDDLATIIEMIGAQHLEGDRIQGKYREFDSNRMAFYCKNIEAHQINALTRNYGIRQQACYILMSLENEKVRREQFKVTTLRNGRYVQWLKKDVILYNGSITLSNG